jgi:phosphate-selective porin OprO/OprP
MLKLLRCTVVAAVGMLVGYSSSSADESAGTGENPPQEEPKPSWLAEMVGFRPLLGGFDDPVTGTHINGQLFVDGAAYTHDKSGQFDNDVGIRRARLAFRHGLPWDLTFKASAELRVNPASIEVKDLYLLYTGQPWGHIVFGNRKEPFSLEALISSRYTTFMENALPVIAMAPGRNVGITIGALWNNRTTLTVGLFGQGFDERGLRASGTALTGRATHLFIDKPEQLLHVGFSGTYRDVETTDTNRFRSTPEVGITDNHMVDTGHLTHAEYVPRAGLEFAYVQGPLSLQSEILASWVARADGLDTLFFHGWYAQGSWFLTGESRPYDRGTARLGQVDPHHSVDKGGKGAWEVALRLSRLDLTDRDVIGGEETNLTIGLNWYLSSTMRAMVNYVNVLEMDRPGSEFDGNTMSLLQLRFQIDF